MLAWPTGSHRILRPMWNSPWQGLPTSRRWRRCGLDCAQGSRRVRCVMRRASAATLAQCSASLGRIGARSGDPWQQKPGAMTASPKVDVNMMVYNCVDTVGAAIESVLAQTWPAVSLTLFDNSSTDGTMRVLQDYADRHTTISIRRNRCNAGPIANIQRALWFGDADYVMPKTSDDLIAPNYIEQLMDVLLANPGCAMCHAAGLVFTGTHQVSYRYPPEHWLEAIGHDPVARSRHVMRRYTSAPGFWGVYRRDAVDQL